MTTMRLGDADLLALLNDTESDRAERKQAWAGDAPTKGAQAICAFANDLPDHRLPGVLFIGATDNGDPVGITDVDRLLQTLADLKTAGNLLPPPTITVEKRYLKGVDMAVVTVQPAHAPPVNYKGRIWIRIGPRRGIATAQDERILNEKRRHSDLPVDLQPLHSATLSDLNRTQFESEYLPAAFAPDILEVNERSYEERLSACRMIESAAEPRPTVLGMLTLGITPRDFIPCSYIEFLRIEGCEWSDPISDNETIDGPVGQMLRRLDDKLKGHIQTGVDFTSEDIERRSPSYPLAALQQLTRNAVMHRTYEATNNPVRLYWFNNRIEIHSPGGPFGIVNAQNFGQAGVTDYRNPHLAEAMKVLGFVQRFGVGIATARKLLVEAGHPEPEFDVQPNMVLATIGHRS